MRRVHALAVAAAIGIAPAAMSAQGMGGMDQSRAVAGGGISVSGWMGKADGKASINDTKFAAEPGGGFHITTGPASTYWNPANTASGNYSVKAMFTEPKYMNLNSHPHPYGVFIAGNDLGTDQPSLLYCEAYGNGTFVVRGFGPAAFQLNGAHGEANAAVHKASAPGEKVTQEVAMSVKGDKVECAINGTTVASYDKAAVVGAGKLKSLDGVYGIRSAHNTEVIVTGFGKQ